MSDGSEPTCGARLRQGGTCRLPPAAGKRRCFQHGGARGIGPPKGSRNAWKHGYYGREQTEQRLRINAFFRECLQTMREIEESWKESEGVTCGLGAGLCHQRRITLPSKGDRASDRGCGWTANPYRLKSTGYIPRRPRCCGWTANPYPLNPVARR